MNVHLIEKDRRFERIDGDVWESGFWSITQARAQQLVGGCIFFHERKRAPSHFGGRILGFRIQPDGEFANRIVFSFEFSPDFRGKTTGPAGWGNEKKFDDDPED